MIDVQASIYVVSRVDESNGIGGNYSTTYTYMGGKADLSGRGLLGFHVVKATDLQTKIVQTSTLSSGLPLYRDAGIGDEDDRHDHAQSDRPRARGSSSIAAAARPRARRR
jgi:hypothetical protein